MPLAPTYSEQDATKYAAKSITAPSYATQSFWPPLAEFIPDIGKKPGQLQEQFKAVGMHSTVHDPIPLNKLRQA